MFHNPRKKLSEEDDAGAKFRRQVTSSLYASKLGINMRVAINKYKNFRMRG